MDMVVAVLMVVAMEMVLDLIVIVVVLMVALNLGWEEREYGKGEWIDTDSIWWREKKKGFYMSDRSILNCVVTVKKIEHEIQEGEWTGIWEVVEGPILWLSHVINWVEADEKLSSVYGLQYNPMLLSI